MTKGVHVGRWYRHRKGAIYRLLKVAMLESDKSLMAVYEGPPLTVWVRPLDEFVEKFDLLPIRNDKEAQSGE